MSRGHWQRRLDDILHRISEIEELSQNHAPEKISEPILNAALERHLSVIGEAVNFIPDTVKAEHPHIPWDKIYKMRNVLIHGYDIVSPSALWDTAESDIEILKTAILAIKTKYGNS